MVTAGQPIIRIARFCKGQDLKDAPTARGNAIIPAMSLKRVFLSSDSDPRGFRTNRVLTGAFSFVRDYRKSLDSMTMYQRKVD